ncbi:MAG: hypothetical protein GTN53_11525 [Candidatus Aminicenantes bacterium]|nr:hypothetical protein [Candidatus Aminicenantes bacterium]NIQ67086.1 hypothetical protein [Candidatus Aminicenantes bacterium]NIT23126.1 hypothetical protein [Candidatus Aminicenantes bacterium]
MPKGEGLFAWRKFKDDCIDERTGLSQAGINNSIFRNEQPDIYLSSDLILWAEELAWERWPGERLYTYIDIKKIKKKETRDAVI